MELLEKIQSTVKYLRSVLNGSSPVLAVQLGTGIATILVDLKILHKISFVDIPHFQIPSAPSHKGNLLIVEMNGMEVLILDGRFHYYEGYSMQEVAFPVYVLKYLGIKHLILTNASGSVHPDIKAGSIVNISDHINLHHDNPLRGPNNEEIGPRFPDMSEAYNRVGFDLINQSAERLNQQIYKGVYLGLSGPNFETPSEYKMARILGADIIGMSTIPEVLAANHCGLNVNAISIVSNQFKTEEPFQTADIDEVLDVVNRSTAQLLKVMRETVSVLGGHYSNDDNK